MEMHMHALRLVADGRDSITQARTLYDDNGEKKWWSN